MTKLATLASRIPFAHLLGVKAADNVDDDEEKKKDAKKAESEEDEAKAEDEDKKPDECDSDKEKKDAKAKKKAQEDEQDETDSDDDEEKMQAAAHAERARCALIVAHGVKTGSVRQACAYAFDTNMSADVAIATLDATAEDRKPAASGGLNERMASTQVPVVGPEANAPAADSPAAVAAMVIASAAKASGKA